MGLQFVDQRPACALFIEGARAFEYKKCTLDRKVFAAIVTNEGVWQLSCSCGHTSLIPTHLQHSHTPSHLPGRVRCVGVVKVCGTVLEMGQ